MRTESSQKVLEVERHLSSSVRAAVPFFHRQAMANLYQVRSLNALRTYERAHDLHAAAKVRNGVTWRPFIPSRSFASLHSLDFRRLDFGMRTRGYVSPAMPIGSRRETKWSIEVRRL